MDLLIPQNKQSDFSDDFSLWNIQTGVTRTYQVGDAVEGMYFEPYKTTNTSNPIDNSPRVRYPDTGGHYAEFVKAFPKWKQYAV